MVADPIQTPAQGHPSPGRGGPELTGSLALSQVYWSPVLLQGGLPGLLCLDFGHTKAAGQGGGDQSDLPWRPAATVSVAAREEA